MKKLFLTIVLSAAAIVFSSCGQNAAVNTNSAANRNQTDGGATQHDSAANRDLAMNGDHAMPGAHHSETKSDAGAANAPYDLQFIDTMTHHHAGAVEMAEMVLRKSQNEELKNFARKIIDDQRREINQMKQWREQWFAGKAPAKNMEMPGMAESMKMMSGDHMKMMDSMTGEAYDRHFLEMMIPHHEDAVRMSKDALQKAERAEIKNLANQIIKAQEEEIKKMEAWKNALGK